MSADEIEALKARLAKLESGQKRIAEIVRRSLFAIIRVLEREFDLPPITN